MPPNYVQLITEAFKDNSMLYLPLDELRARQDVLLESFFDYHYTNCEKYRKFCEGRNVTPDMIKGLDDISKIPLLDSFKTLRKTQFRSVKRKNIITQFSSTGSSGKPLLWIYLDQLTMDWMVQGMIYLLQTHINMKSGATLMMLPDVPQLKFAQTSLKVLPQLKNDFFFGLRATFGDDPRPIIEPNAEGIDAFMQHPAKIKNLIGFPFTITQLYDYLEEKNMKLSLGRDAVIVTGGGWKPRQKDSKWAKIMRAEMEKYISTAFDIPVENIRDVYGCTEILLGYMECSHKRYHVPPWCYHAAVDPNDLSILENGTKGLGVCYDFVAHSWPAFVLTEDFIKVSDEPCPCGISGQTIEYLGRIQDADPRGCAFKFEDKLFSEDYISQDLPKPNTQSTDGLLQFLAKNNAANSEKFINEHIDIFNKAIAMINEITTFTSDELTSIEEYKIFKFITLGKLLCYKEGTPTILSEQEIMDHMGLPLDAVKSILKLFEKRDFIKIVKKDNQTLYRYTKKADEFGEAFYPLLIWALKYMHV